VAAARKIKYKYKINDFRKRQNNVMNKAKNFRLRSRIWRPLQEKINRNKK
jgi:hypothetical protein